MAYSVVNTVIDTLKDAGFRAATAYRGEPVYEVTAPTIAVSLYQVNQQERLTEVLARVMCPADMGGSYCELVGLRVLQILTEMGASCVLEGMEYDEKHHLLTVSIFAALRGGLLGSVWNPGGDLTVALGTTILPNATDFTARQETEDSAPVESCPWKFTLEEFFYPGDPEQSSPAEPFSILVNRSARAEVYQNCRFTRITRAAGPTGLRLTREGTAESMIPAANS